MNDANNYDAALADKILIRMIAFTQMLMSLAGFAMIPFLFMYGGAAANPELFAGILFYLFCGFVFAFILYSRGLLARILCLSWHGAFLGSAIWILARLPTKGTAVSSSAPSVLTASALSFFYLAATSFPKIKAAAQKDPEATRKFLLGGFAVFLAVALYIAYIHVTAVGGPHHGF